MKKLDRFIDVSLPYIAMTALCVVGALLGLDIASRRSIDIVFDIIILLIAIIILGSKVDLEV